MNLDDTLMENILRNATYIITSTVKKLLVREGEKFVIVCGVDNNGADNNLESGGQDLGTKSLFGKCNDGKFEIFKVDDSKLDIQLR